MPPLQFSKGLTPGSRPTTEDKRLPRSKEHFIVYRWWGWRKTGCRRSDWPRSLVVSGDPPFAKDAKDGPPALRTAQIRLWLLRRALDRRRWHPGRRYAWGCFPAAGGAA